MPPPVVLLHGLGRTRRSMAPLEFALRRGGFRPVNLGYPSTRHPIEWLAQRHLKPVVAALLTANSAAIHFVTHSMGALVLRQCLQDARLPAGSRAVLLSPPNRGSEIAERMRGNLLYRHLLGPAGQQLGIGPEAIWHRLRPVHLEIGVIAGRLSINPWFSGWIQGPDDGKVAVSRTRLSEMTAFRTIACSHEIIMWHPRSIEETIHFLRHGRFRRHNM